jgi:hypothetical protein
MLGGSLASPRVLSERGSGRELAISEGHEKLLASRFYHSFENMHQIITENLINLHIIGSVSFLDDITDFVTLN